MNDQTEFITKVEPPQKSLNGNGHSTVFGVSWRGWIVMLFVLTICTQTLRGIELSERLLDFCLTIIGVYIGQKFPGK